MDPAVTCDKFNLPALHSVDVIEVGLARRELDTYLRLYRVWPAFGRTRAVTEHRRKRALKRAVWLH
jgi:hypothetical protein